MERHRRDAVIDVHCHLFGKGDGGSGVWIHPSLESLLTAKLEHAAGLTASDPLRF